MSLFAELSLIIVIAAGMAALMHLLRQPLIIGHIITGLIIAPTALGILQSPDALHIFSEFGIAFLLFIVGLGLNPRLIKEVGTVSLITGTGQVIFTSIVGFAIALALGFREVTALYIAIALTFSSTIIIVKLLSDKQELNKLYGKISLGFLLVQDIIATFILIGISSFASGTDVRDVMTQIIVQGFFLLIALALISRYILPRLSSFFARSQEFLFLFSIAWGLGLATLFDYFGFSIEIGALIAGVTISMSSYSLEISAKMKPLRDFFIVLFFIGLGAQLSLTSVSELWLPITVFSLFVLIGNPLIVIVLMGLLGYKKKTSFLTGLTVAQISEFSIILIMLGMKIGRVEPEILSLITAVGLITIVISTYFILYAEKIYPRLAALLSVFERSQPIKEGGTAATYDIILFGHNRIGSDFITTFKKLRKKYLVVDFDPAVIDELEQKGITCSYGDVDDADFLDELPLANIKMAVSTIPECSTNSLLLRKIRRANDKAVVIVISHSIHEAEKLYERGASYVILPHFLGGTYTARMIARYGFRKALFAKERREHLKYLEQRKVLGYEHPSHERSR